MNKGERLWCLHELENRLKSVCEEMMRTAVLLDALGDSQAAGRFASGVKNFVAPQLLAAKTEIADLWADRLKDWGVNP